MRMHAADNAEEAVAALVGRLAPVVAAAQDNAQRLDRSGGFPAEDVAGLTKAGAIGAVVPTLMGGLGIGTEAARAVETANVLQLIGSGSIALGRIFEGHLNAIRLVLRNGTAAQQRTAANDARAGHLHALWVTDGPDMLHFVPAGDYIELSGEKHFCSAAGQATRAVVTAMGPSGETRLLLLPLGNGEVVKKLPAGLQGVRSAATGRVDFTGAKYSPEVLFGAPDSYLREPEFSAGAWRACAVTVGALSALTDCVRAELLARGRAGNTEQRQRLGRMFMNAQTARLWLAHAAPVAENADGQPEFAIATVNLARLSIEAACVDSIQLAQRCLGLSAFLQTNPVERLCRDIATYLRQPAPDEALSAAAEYFTAHPQDTDIA